MKPDALRLTQTCDTALKQQIGSAVSSQIETLIALVAPSMVVFLIPGLQQAEQICDFLLRQDIQEAHRHR